MKLILNHRSHRADSEYIQKYVSEILCFRETTGRMRTSLKKSQVPCDTFQKDLTEPGVKICQANPDK